jgi:hypothetical protein
MPGIVQVYQASIIEQAGCCDWLQDAYSLDYSDGLPFEVVRIKVHELTARCWIHIEGANSPIFMCILIRRLQYEASCLRRHDAYGRFPCKYQKECTLTGSVLLLRTLFGVIPAAVI